MSSARETFNKSERLCSTKAISNLFENGNIFYSSIFKVIWSRSPISFPSTAQVAFSVSKKGFRLAVARNLIKRRMREAYRKNKHKLYEQLSPEKIQVTFVVILTGNTVPDYLTIERSMKEVINKLINIVKEEKLGVS